MSNMELEVQGSKCKKYSVKGGERRALHISLMLNDPFCNISWKSTRPKTSGLFLRQKKEGRGLKNFGLDLMFRNGPVKAQKILSQTPSPMKNYQRRGKKGTGAIYSPIGVIGGLDVGSSRIGDEGKRIVNSLGDSLNIGKMRFSPKGKNFMRGVQRRTDHGT